MDSKMKMVGDVVFDSLNDTTVRVMYCNKGRQMITRSILTGKYFDVDISKMSDSKFNSRFTTLESLFSCIQSGWNFPPYPNDSFYGKNTDIDVYLVDARYVPLNSSMSSTRGIRKCIPCLWDLSEGCPIRNGNLYLRVYCTMTKLVIPLSEVLIPDVNAGAYMSKVSVGDESLEKYYANNDKIVFAQSNVLSYKWRKGLLVKGTNVKHIEYRWSSDSKIDIRDDGDVYFYQKDIKDFCGDCPKYSLIFDDKYVAGVEELSKADDIPRTYPTCVKNVTNSIYGMGSNLDVYGEMGNTDVNISKNRKED